MSPHVRLEIPRPTESRRAHLAHVGLHGRVLARVRPQVGGARKGRFALAAPERLLAAVLLQVNSQVALRGERGFAVRALERLALAVDAPVNGQVGGFGEDLSALRAAELPPGLVLSAVAVEAVSSQAGHGREFEVAVAARVRLARRCGVSGFGSARRWAVGWR